MAGTKWEARVQEFREMVADNGRVKTLLRLLRDHFPDAFVALVQRLDTAYEERRTAAEATLPLPLEEMDEGSLEEEEGV